MSGHARLPAYRRARISRRCQGKSEKLPWYLSASEAVKMGATVLSEDDHDLILETPNHNLQQGMALEGMFRQWHGRIRRYFTQITRPRP